MPGGGADPAADDWRAAHGLAAQLRTAWRTLATSTAGALLALYAANRDDSDALTIAGSALLVVANQRSTTLADLYVAHLLRADVVGLEARSNDAARLELSIATAIDPDTGIAPDAALERLGQAEPLRAGQLGLHDGMAAHEVEGWTRVTGGDPCKVCADLADGSVLPAGVEMYHHPGCSCVAQPVTRKA